MPEATINTVNLVDYPVTSTVIHRRPPNWTDYAYLILLAIFILVLVVTA